MSKMLLSAAVSAVTVSAASSSASPPRTCATYFDFRKTLQSDYHFGVVHADGSITERANMGQRFDPQVRS
jgi:hypothetical protein